MKQSKIFLIDIEYCYSLMHNNKAIYTYSDITYEYLTNNEF